jgi:hypothetical protein
VLVVLLVKQGSEGVAAMPIVIFHYEQLQQHWHHQQHRTNWRQIIAPAPSTAGIASTSSPKKHQ